MQRIGDRSRPQMRIAARSSDARLEVVLAILGLLGVCVIAGMIGLIVPKALAEGKAQRETVPKWARSFPLWMGVPRKSFATLGEGVIHKRRWGAYVYRGYGTLPGRTPCVQIGSLYFGSGRGGVFQNGSECAGLAPPAEEPILNESGFSIKPGFHTPFVSDTVIALAVGESVVKVKLSLLNGRQVLKPTRLLSAGQAEKANVSQFRYVVFAMAQKGCVVSTVGYDVAGGVLFESPARSCQ